MTEKKSRNYGLDEMRLVMSFLIVMHHVLLAGGIIQAAEPFGLNWFLASALDVLGACAVNGFAVLSGYVGVDGRFRWKNFVSLWLTVLFYSLGIGLLVGWKEGNLSVMAVLRFLFPIMSSQYWYITAYAALFLFMPFVNAGIQNMEEKTLKTILKVMLILFSVLPVLVRNDPFSNRGFSFTWLLVMYVLGGVLKKTGFPLEGKKIPPLVVILTSAVLVTAGNLVLSRMGMESFQLNWVSYICPLYVLIAAENLRMFSSHRLRGKRRKFIKAIAPTALSIYLIHVHPSLFGFIQAAFVEYGALNPVWMVIRILLTVCGIFFGCMAVDLARILLFRLLHMEHLAEWIGNQISERL